MSIKKSRRAAQSGSFPSAQNHTALKVLPKLAGNHEIACELISGRNMPKALKNQSASSRFAVRSNS
ncbi:MAG: hypothetical protein ONA90_06895, partial [candidate division KSB1 bacterium]|nr:hypothetical protein [candidate division KSB1 bacterium]